MATASEFMNSRSLTARWLHELADALESGQAVEEQWSDEQHLYLETRVETSVVPDLDLSINGRVVFVRVELAKLALGKAVAPVQLARRNGKVAPPGGQRSRPRPDEGKGLIGPLGAGCS